MHAQRACQTLEARGLRKLEGCLAPLSLTGGKVSKLGPDSVPWIEWSFLGIFVREHTIHCW